MGSIKSPLKATFDTAYLKLGRNQDSFPLPISGYRGKPLYCHASVAGGVLSVTVDEQFPNDGPVSGAASSADIKVVILKQTVRYHVQNLNFKSGSVVTATVRLSPRLDHALLYIEDEQRQSLKTDIDLGFVLIQETKPPQYYRMEWIDPVIVVAAAEEPKDSSVVPPDHTNQPGVIGPMGFTTP